jgi:monovalent cation/proton antiporter MnhG/PhaG subunit
MILASMPWFANVLALLGLVVLTLSVYGILRLPDVRTRIHAAGNAAVLGVLPLVIAAVLGSDTAALPKAVLIGGFMILTGPIVAHEIGRAEHLQQRRPPFG